jgi:tetratricopeptide (TPR) repeat protein
MGLLDCRAVDAELRLRKVIDWCEVIEALMKLRISLLLAMALLSGGCNRTRLSPVVLQTPSEDKASKPAGQPVPKPAAVAKSTGVAKPAVVAAPEPSKGMERSKVVGAERSAAEHPVAKVESKADKVAEAARLAAKKKRLAAARRAQARRLAAASLEAGRQLLREEQNGSALKAFRESVRLNSNSPEAWMGIAFVCERTGNTKDALEAFREAKKLWGM